MIGGIGLSGGKGGIRNVIVGTLLIGVLLNGMTILDMPYTEQNIIKSLILLVAIVFDSLVNPRDEQTAQQGGHLTRRAPRLRYRASEPRNPGQERTMRLRQLLFALAACAVGLPAAHAQKAEDLTGKTVAFLPVALGFDLTEGWSAILKSPGRGVVQNPAFLGYTRHAETASL